MECRQDYAGVKMLTLDKSGNLEHKYIMLPLLCYYVHYSTHPQVLPVGFILPLRDSD